MASLDPTLEAAPEEKQDTSGMSKASQEEELDLQIAVTLGQKLMRNAGGLQAVEKAISSSQDPVQVVSKFLVQLVMQIKDAVAEQGVDLSPSIVLGQGGWLVQMLDLLETELGLPAEFSDGIVDDVIETFKALSQGGKRSGLNASTSEAQGGTPPQGQQAPTPQGAPTGLAQGMGA